MMVVKVLFEEMTRLKAQELCHELECNMFLPCKLGGSVLSPHSFILRTLRSFGNLFPAFLPHYTFANLFIYNIKTVFS